MSTQTIPVIRNADGYPIIPQGPDIWLFPDIDGCYAVRQNPHRWGGSPESNITYIYGYTGRSIGEYHEYMRDGVKSSLTMLVDRSQRRLDISLENATRFCYLFKQNYISDTANSFPIALVPSEDNKMFAALLGITGYAIFTEDGKLIAHLGAGEAAMYYPTSHLDRIQIKMSKKRNYIDRYPKLPTNAFEILPMLDTAFDFISRCE